MRLNIGGKILIGLVVVVAVAWVALRNRQESARVHRLASLPPCGLAAEYMQWRLAFEESHPPGEITGTAAENFAAESDLFQQAARRAQRDSPSRVLEELESLTVLDSTEWVHEDGDIDSFVEVMISACPDEVQGLISGAKQ